MVDGQPWLIRGGEVANTASSSLPYMETVWPKMTRLNLNTVLVAVAWAWVEPEEGKFDFSLVDGLLDGARRNHQRVIFLWFGSWKNGLSSFAPTWVKTDQRRFPRVRIKSGKPVEILSTFSEATLAADTRAYVKFLEHLHQVDAKHTVLMIQLQNEVGVLGDSRDRGDAAGAAFAGPVPAAILDWLRQHQADRFPPDLVARWTEAGRKPSGSWEEIFGVSPATDELFMAWHYARFLDHMAAAGKAAHALPVFTNTWLVQPEDKGPGDYPSGGPQPFSLILWKLGAPAIDLNAPDIYLPNFVDHAEAFRRENNPLFVPESRGDAVGVTNAIYAIGSSHAIGYSPFGIDNTARLAAGQAQPADLESQPLAKGYALLRDLTPLILEAQSKGAICGANFDAPTEEAWDASLGNYGIHITLRRNRRDPKQLPPYGCCLVINLGPDEYLVAGQDVQLTFQPRGNDVIAGIAEAQLLEAKDGKLVAVRQLNGDDIVLDYKLAEAADNNQSGSGLRFGPDGPTIQRVKLYRYK
jgi:hypothetical protein